MENINKYLTKFSKSIGGFELNKKEIIEAIKKEINLEINSKNIEIKNTILYIKTSPAVKNILFIHKQNILKKIVKLNISDIK